MASMERTLDSFRADFDDFTSTTSPAWSSSRSKSYARSISVTNTDSPSHEPF